MASVNQVTIIGYVGDEPKVKDFGNGNKVVNLTIATTEKGYTTKDGREIPEKTEWHNVALWRNMANYASQYVHKGTLVYVQGKLRTRTYEQNGEKRYVTDIEAENFQVLEKRDAQTKPQPQMTQQDMFPNVGAPTPKQKPTDYEDMDNDLPF